MPERKRDAFSMVYMTAKDEADGLRMGRELVRERLVACANVLPVRSVYRWQGDVVEEAEAVVIMKTRRSLVPRVMARARELHTYRVPCLVTYRMEGALDDYAKWMLAGTG